jgi:hypothetical protein
VLVNTHGSSFPRRRKRESIHQPALASTWIPAFAFAFAGMTILFCAPSALARPSSLVGAWHLDLTRSELLPGEEKPADLTMAVIKEDASGFQWTVTVRMPDGATGSTGFVGAIDGKPYPIKGRTGSTSAFSWTPEGALKQVSQGPGGIAVEICTFTPDARTMDCEVKQTDMQGRVAVYEEVYRRL